MLSGERRRGVCKKYEDIGQYDRVLWIDMGAFRAMGYCLLRCIMYI